ncbi:hypothetical protein CEXT_646951 [Caerostris extrusa]|uniref:Uncharacterized protein n=1 Tax=Caerostris extrusa TaxID=172846 RepID=A0AAV4NES8_CAEEX|nr:hypothetical protein CEXT_646951 [Caerostris extrusa]
MIITFKFWSTRQQFMSCQIIKLAALPASFPAAVFEAKSFKITESSLRNSKATFDTHASREFGIPVRRVLRKYFRAGIPSRSKKEWREPPESIRS